jgi:hypothetical protein
MPIRKPLPPLLLGRPSPSLARIKRMNMADLSERIERLKTEAIRIERRIQHLKIQTPLPQAQIDNLESQTNRLEVLTLTACKRLDQKQQNKEAYHRSMNR